ncbi:MAG: NYN domain-containing protein [Chloroflexi bacterium]|nr:NYN domain-containing protein [Chloroflexota bacterium]MCY3582880.1 NYN domain-containing protein [Chloroflexota bacterium]MCY3715686.1 NYN domain-containing protein [Chloroflexota bacterium]MDE2650576.1 NYN domain-containing protein [Chloroflexota bacterium]MXX51930.1 NYN domain-containing protein [Chloroflexota bacterium]
MPHLIDGHNLIASLPDIGMDDPHKEAKLVNKLKSWAAATSKKCTIVFDRGLPGGASKMGTSAVAVIFAADQRSDADTLIKRRISRARDRHAYTVVSSDNDVRGFAQRKGLKVITSAAFSRELQRRTRPQAARGEEVNPVISESEVDELLAMFNSDGGNSRK